MRVWLVPYADLLACFTRAGFSLRFAEQGAERVNIKGKPDRIGRYAAISCDGDPRRASWGIFGLPAIPGAFELAPAPAANLFAARGDRLFS